MLQREPSSGSRQATFRFPVSLRQWFVQFDDGLTLVAAPAGGRANRDALSARARISPVPGASKGAQGRSIGC